MDISEYKYKIEAHCHTKPVSKCGNFTAEELVKTYKAGGADAIVLTNHFMKDYLSQPKENFVNEYLSDYYKAKEAGEKCGLTVIFGMEIRFSNENINDYMVYGIDEDFVKDAYEMLEGTLEQFYKTLKNDKNIIIQAHPLRDGCAPADFEFLDGIEAFNMHPNHNQRQALAYRLAMEQQDFIITTGSDFHHKNHEMTGVTLAKALPKDSFEFAELLKSGDYLFSLGGLVALPYTNI